MTLLALVLPLLLSADAPPAPTDLVTPAGVVFRAFEVAPIQGANGGRAGIRVAYAASSRDPARLGRDADALAAAVGPELAAANQPALVVRAVGRKGGFDVAFERQGEGFRRVPAAGAAAKVPAGFVPQPAAGAAADRVERERTGAAAAAAVQWLYLLDDGRAEAAVAAAAPAFRAEIQATTQWRELQAQRQALRSPTARQERYRAQTRGPDGAWKVAVQFETRGADGARFLERTTLIEDGGGWKVGGYGVRPVVGP